MKNYYEILAYADREDLLVEKTNTDTYIGFKDGENSKTLFKFSDGTDPLKDFLEELQNTKHKESNLYKVVAKALIKDLINDLKIDIYKYDIVSNVAIINEFKTITGYEYDETDIDDLGKCGIVLDDKRNLVNRSYCTKKWLLEDIFRTRKITVSEKNIEDVSLILPDYSYIVSEVDWDIIEDTLYYENYNYSTSIVRDSDYYEDLESDIRNLLKMIKENEITVEYENNILKDKIVMRVFWALSSASNLLDNNGCDFSKDYLNYYNTFYNGKVVDSEKMMP